MKDKNKKSMLSKEISFGKVSKWPSKTTINFVSDEQAKQDRKALVIFLIFLILLIPFTYFGVYGMIKKVNDAEGTYRTIQSQITDLESQTSDYATVKAEYDSVTGSYMTDDERADRNRMEIFTMIEEDITPSISVQAIAIDGTKVTIQSGSTDLTTVSSVITKLQSDSRNKYVTVTTTSASSSNKDSVLATFEITFATSSTGGTQS